MVQDDSSAAATKGDMKILKSDIHTLQEQLTMLAGYVGTLPTKEENNESERHILTAFENLRHEMINAHTDKISQHEGRILALEVVTGLKR